jgi:dipeptidyl aminopeptidase/acylaminoacyl peptidase
VAAKRMLAQLGYVDTTKIGIIGGRYGGYMTLAAVTLQPDEFKVGVDLFGIMVLQGANDPRVLQIESDEIVAAAKKNGVAVEYVVFPDEGHAFVKKENEIRGYSGLLAFLDQHLKGQRPLASVSAASIAVPVTGRDSTKAGAKR